MEEDPSDDPSHTPSNRTDQIADEKGKAVEKGAADQHFYRLAESPYTADMDVDVDVDADLDKDTDIGEGTSNPTPDESSGSDPAPSTNESKPKSAFVKLTELKETEMVWAYLQAFFGGSHDVLEAVIPSNGGYFGEQITSIITDSPVATFTGTSASTRSSTLKNQRKEVYYT